MNNLLIERYYLKRSQIALEKLYESVDHEHLISNYTVQQRLEKEEGILTAYIKGSDDLEVLNTRIISALSDKGLKLMKFWLWEEDYTKLKTTGIVNKLYNQKQLDYSVLMKFTTYEEGILIFAKLIPHLTETIQLINQFTTGIFLLGMLGMIIMVIFLVRRMTRPLSQLSDLATQIAQLDFQKVEINTHDEIEDLAHHINDMSDHLKAAHESLERKNKQMKKLLANIAHELKTPIALIKAYALGMQDGMDDGTFLDTILLQNEDMHHKVQSLLNLAQIEEGGLHLTTVNLTQLLKDKIKMQAVPIEKEDIEIEEVLEEECYAYVDAKEIGTVFENLITNAMKYTLDKKITITLIKEDATAHLTIRNHMNPETTLEIEEIWKPFYVGESSRSKLLSGTGLGLSIVKAILDKHRLSYTCDTLEGSFIFKLRFNLENSIIEKNAVK